MNTKQNSDRLIVSRLTAQGSGEGGLGYRDGAKMKKELVVMDDSVVIVGGGGDGWRWKVV